jgi:amino acid adenylation domain-containing protein
MNRKNVEDLYPLSPLQQGMLFHTLYAPEADAYAEQVVLTLAGEVRSDEFAAAWQRVIDRTPALRTGFVWEGVPKPLQVVFREAAVPFVFHDWSGVDEEERDRRFAALVADDRARPFILASAPLIRLALVRTGADEHRLLFTFHHLLIDGWSIPLVFHEVLALHAGALAGVEPALPSRRPFRDYIAWLGKQDAGAMEEFWRARLAGFSAPTPLPLDADPGRRGVPAQEHGQERIILPAALMTALDAVGRHHRVTGNTVMQGAWGVLLARYAGVDDVVFGATVSGRPAELPGVEATIGMFINAVPVRVRIPGELPVAEWLRGLQAEQADARQFEHAPLAGVKGWSEMPGDQPLFETLFVFENFPLDGGGGAAGGAPAGVQIVAGHATERTNYALSLAIAPALEGTRVTATYDARRLDPERVKTLLAAFRTILGQIVEGGARPASALTPLGATERRRIVEEWGGGSKRFPVEATIHSRFAERARSAPSGVAVTFGGESLTYAELDARSNRLARHLRELGVAPEARVGVAMERSAGLVVALLAILKAGAAYVPLDPSYPEERLDFLRRDSGVSVLVVDGAAAPGEIPTVSLARDAAAIASRSADPLPDAGGPDALAYVIYTSGSTGRPKGVEVTHANVLRLFAATDEWFGFSDGDVWTLFHSYAFDFSVWESWGALLYGGRLVVVPFETSRSPEAFYELLERERVTVLNQTPSAFRPLMRADDEAAGRGAMRSLALRHVVFGGEALDVATLRGWIERRGDESPRLVNMYGITETTVHVTYRVVTRNDLERASASPIGVPIPDLALYVLDSTLEPVPAGAFGEMYVGGGGVARGYLGRPALTAERFVPDPFRSGGRLYRTGDRARWTASGELEYGGRNDEQVKIRGFRIEPGEVEAALAALPAVAEAAVVVRGDGPARQLVGYAVPRAGSTPTGEELRAALAGLLPEYMVPAVVVTLDRMPLTANGKIDRRALPDVETGPDADTFTPPRTPTETTLARVWAEVLKVERVGIHDNFFALGGDSIVSIQVISRAAKEGVRITPRQVFLHPTVAELATELGDGFDEGGANAPSEASSDRATAAPADAPGGHTGDDEALPALRPRGAGEGPLPLSFAQERMFFLERLDPTAGAYNIALALEARGALDLGALSAALSGVVARHEVLRTTFAEEEGRAVQHVHPAAPLEVRVAEVDAIEAARSRAGEEMRRPFDLTRETPLRAIVYRASPELHLVLVVIHHSAADGWSLGILLDEITALYAAHAAGTAAELPPVELQYADFAAWQRRAITPERLVREVEFWRGTLAGAPALLELPLDRPRPPTRSHRGAAEPLHLAPELTRRLNALAAEERSTPFILLLAAWGALLARLGGQDEVVVGTPVAGRTRSETERVVGMFVNTLPLRVTMADAPAFRDLLGRVRDTTLAALAHDALPFERLVEELGVERSMGHAPLFQSILVLQNAPAGGGLSFPGVELGYAHVEGRAAKFDLGLDLAPMSDGGMQGVLEYATDIFDRATVARIGERLVRFLEAVVETPELSVAEVELHSPEERRRLRERAVGTPPAAGPEAAHRMIEARVRIAPDAPALVTDGERLTYAELDRRASRIARRLQAAGVGPEARVALLLERGADPVIGALAVWKAGGAYVPVDPAYPATRRAFMLSDSGARVVLTRAIHRAEAAECGAQVLLMEDDDPSAPDVAVSADVWPESAAYVIYTSGSTGRPKGVVVPHRGLASMRATMVEAFAIEPASRVLQFASFSFDAAVGEVMTTLTTGACLVTIPREAAVPGPELIRWMRAERVTVGLLAPSVLAVLADADLPDLVSVVSGGEALGVETARQWSAGRRLVNGYGPTENTVLSSLLRVEAEVGGPRVPIGHPFPGVRAVILDSRLRLAPEGSAGELFVGGAQVSRGYLGRAALTAERFVPDAFSGEPGARLYRTGDRVRWNAAGELDFLGRTDAQVKLRGFRVEPGEVESALGSLDGVREAIVVVDSDARGGTRLVGYAVPAPGSETDGEALRAALATILPAHMVPAAVVVIGALPLTPNGKIDRRALPAPEWTTGAAHGAPLTPTQEIVAGVWSDLLGAGDVGPDDDFFALGGHSLLATRVVSRVRQAFGVELPIRAVFEEPTLARFAELVDAAVRAGAGATDAPPIVAVPRDGDVPASFAQERLWVLQRMDPESPAYNMPTALRIAGALDASALERALGELVARHEALRTVFAELDGAPVQHVLPPAPFRLAVVDASDVPPAERDAVAARMAAESAVRPFDLAAGPLFRASLARLAEGDHLLLMNVHHAVSDGWSMGVIFRELSELYTAFRAGKESPLAPLAVQYPDFSVWQREWLRGEALERQVGYWRERLAGAPALLQLPTDRPRPAVQGHGGGTVVRVLPRELLERAEALSRHEGATLFMVLLAAFNVVLGRLAGQDDVVVGTPIAGRTRHETEGLIGLFLNTLALRTRLDGDPSFRELLARVREATLGAYAHQDVAFERLLEELRPERSLSHSPIFQVMLNLVNLGGGIALSDLEISGVDQGELPSKVDFTLYASETEEGLYMQLIYAAELFDAARMEELLGQLAGVLEEAVAAPERAIGSLSLVTPEARSVLPDTATELSAEWRGSVAERFAEHVARTPDALAVADPRERWSYAELDRASGRIANRLVADGVRPGDVVAVFAHRDAAIVRALLGILRAGGAFLVLDPAYPAARLAEYVRTATPRALVHIAAAGALPDALAAALDGLPALVLGARGASAEEADGLAGVSPEAPRVRVGADSLAYLAFTSGTTGEPKAVMGRQGSLTHFTPWVADAFGLGADDRISMLSGLAHDPLQRDIFIPLQIGAAVIAPEPEEVGTPGYLAGWMRAEGITVANLAPAMVQWVAGTSGDETVPSLRRAFFVGEALTRADTDRLHRVAPGVTIVNFYGSTETQRAVSYQVVERGGGAGEREVIPLGKGLPDVQLLVRTPAGAPAGIGEAGEVWIRSPHIALGYLRDEALTAERFLATPGSSDPADRMYRTGDLGRYRLDGAVDPMGRADGQVKVRGFRVELGEVEAALGRHPAVREAAVVARGGGADRRLVAYVVPVDGAMDADALRQHLRALLPEFMLPAAFVELDELPLTANRKVDRRALPEPESAAGASVAPPRTPLEEVVAAIWAEVLGRDSVGVDEDFFAAGGHSLRATQVLARIETALGVRLRLRTLFESPTVAGLAAAIEAEGGGELAAMMADLNELTDAEIEALLAAEAAADEQMPSESR